MGDTFGSQAVQTPRVNLQNLISDLFVSSLYGTPHSGNPDFANLIAQFTGQQQQQPPPGQPQPPGQPDLPGQPGTSVGSGFTTPGGGGGPIPIQQGGSPAIVAPGGVAADQSGGLFSGLGGPGPQQPPGTYPGNFSLASFIQQMFSAPTYGGPLAPDQNAMQVGSNNNLTQLANSAAAQQPTLQSLIQSGLGGIAGGQGAGGSQLMQQIQALMGQANPAQFSQQQAALSLPNFLSMLGGAGQPNNATNAAVNNAFLSGVQQQPALNLAQGSLAQLLVQPNGVSQNGTNLLMQLANGLGGGGSIAQAIQSLMNPGLSAQSQVGQVQSGLTQINNQQNPGLNALNSLVPQSQQQTQAGSQALSGVAGGANPTLSQALQGLLGGQGGAGQAQNALMSAAGQQAPGLSQAQSAIQGLLGGGQSNNTLSQLAQSGGAPNYQALFSALQNASNSQQALNERDIREQYSATGNRFGTDLAGALGQSQTQQAANLNALMAQLGMSAAQQQTGTQLGAAQALGNQQGSLAQALGQLGLSQQGQSLQALQGAGQLGLGGQQNTIQSLLGAGGLAQGAQGQQLQAGQALSQLGQSGLLAALQGGQAQQGQQANIANMIAQLGLSGQQLAGQQLAQAGQLGLGQQGQLSQIGQALAQLGIGQQGQQTATAQTLGQLGLGAQSNQAQLSQILGQLGLGESGQQLQAGQAGTQAALSGAQGLGNLNQQQASLLASLGQTQQGQAIQALLGLPGATSTLDQNSLAAQQALGQAGQQQYTNQLAAINSAIQQFYQTQGALFPSVLNYAAGAPLALQPSAGQQLLGAGTTLGAAKLGAK